MDDLYEIVNFQSVEETQESIKKAKRLHRFFEEMPLKTPTMA